MSRNRYRISIQRLSLAETVSTVSSWVVKNKIASKATFSRRKDFLKNLGIITEENAEMPFGRPKIRLFLNEQKLKEYLWE